MPSKERKQTMVLPSHERRQPLSVSSSMFTCNEGYSPSLKLNSAPMIASPPKTAKFSTSSQRIQQTTKTLQCKFPRKSPDTSLETFLASSSGTSVDYVEKRWPASLQKRTVKTASRSPQKQSSRHKRNQAPPAVLASEKAAYSPSRSMQQQSIVATNFDGNSTPQRQKTRQTVVQSGSRVAEAAADTPRVSCPRKPERTADMGFLATMDHDVKEQDLRMQSTNENASNPVMASQRSLDCVPTKPTRTPSSKGSKTKNAVFRPKTPQKRSIKKGVKLCPTSMSIIASPAARMNALTVSPKARFNLRIDIVSPVAKDAVTHSPDTPYNNIFIDKMKAPDLAAFSPEKGNDSNSSLQISDIAAPPTRGMQMSLLDLLGRSLPDKTDNGESISDLFDLDGENETIWTEDTYKPLCQDRWHCSTPCLPSSDFLVNQTSVRRLQWSPTIHASFDSHRNSSSSELFMPSMPRRHNSRECS